MYSSVADPEGVRGGGGGGGSHEPLFETKVFNFHGEFSKNQEKLIYNQVKLTNRTPPFVNLNPLSKNPGSAPGFSLAK